MDNKQTIDYVVMDKKQKFSFAGIIVSALLTITCCVGPAVLLLTGASISFLGNLSFLEPFRPLFILTGAVFLGIAFWTTFIKKRQCACSADHRKARIAQIITIVGLLIFIVSLFFTQIVTFIVGG